MDFNRSTFIRLSHTSSEVKWFKIHEHFKQKKNLCTFLLCLSDLPKTLSFLNNMSKGQCSLFPILLRGVHYIISYQVKSI